MVSSELVKLALCFIILTVSLSKCEIDSSTVKVQPSGFPPRAPTTSSGDVALKTTHSSSTSSSSTSFSAAGGAPTTTTTTSNNDGRTSTTEQQRIGAPSTSRHNNASTNIISSTITPTPTVASPIWTSLYSPKQEVGGGRGAVEARETSQQLQQQPTRHYQLQDNNNNKREEEDFSTSYSPAFIITNREKLAGVAAVPVLGDLLSTSLPRVEKQSTTSSRNSFQRGFTPSIPSQQILGTVFPGDNGSDEELIPNEDYSDRSSSPIPRHTWLPGGLTFSCKNRVPGYYADASSIAKCQVYHMCMTDGRKYSMLCGIGTVFNQLTFVCDHWYNYRCSDAETDYKINSQLWEDLVGEEEEDNVDADEGNNRAQIGDQVIVGDSDNSGRPRGAIHPPPPQISSSRLSTTRQALS